MRGMGFLFPASRIQIVKCAKCYYSSENTQRFIHILKLPSRREEQLSPVSLSDSNAVNCSNTCPDRYMSDVSRVNNAERWRNIDNSKTLHFILLDNISSDLAIADSRRLIHTSSVVVSDSLGADSTGLTSAKSAKEEFEKWKASIDFDLLTEAHMRIHNAHMKAIEEKKETYTDPVSDFEVFTIMTHLLRGNCCGNVCRHCPYGHVNAPKEYKEHMRYNTAFYY